MEDIWSTGIPVANNCLAISIFSAIAFAYIPCAGGNDPLDGRFVYRGIGSVRDGTGDGAYSSALESVWKMCDPFADPAGRPGDYGLRHSCFAAFKTSSVHAYPTFDRRKL